MNRASTISMWASKFPLRKNQWTVDEGLLRSLTPLNLLGSSELKSLVPLCTVLRIKPGKQIANTSATTKRTLYLLSGTVETVTARDITAIIAADTEASRQPVLTCKSGDMQIRAKTEAVFLELGMDVDELLLHSGAAGDYEVSDIRSATATDWLTRFLQAEVFIRLPPSNIRELLSRMEEINVKAGQVIMHQGDADDYYYIVKQGVCRVTTRPSKGGEEMTVAELKEGDGFGEDALITNGRRGATVTVVNDGSLMRLSKEDFTSLLVAPVLKYVTWEQAQALLMKDNAVLLDVRRPEEYAADGIEGALNIPLGLLRSRAHELDGGRIHITVSNVLNRSSAAAFLLCQQGIDACILRDGAHATVPAHRPAPRSAKGDARSAAQVRPVTVLHPKEAERGLRAELSAVKAELKSEKTQRQAMEKQWGALNDELQRLHRERAADQNLKSELTALKEELERESAHKRAAENELAALKDELQRLRREHAADQELKSELASLKNELEREQAHGQAAGREFEALQNELQRLHREHAAGNDIKSELAALKGELGRETDRRHSAESELASLHAQIEHLHHERAEDDGLKSELASVRKELEQERMHKQTAERELATLNDQLQRLHQSQETDEHAKAELSSVKRNLEREIELNRVLEQQLERQNKAMARFQDHQQEDDGLQAELVSLRDELEREQSGRQAAENGLAAQNDRLQHLQQQLNRFRGRLKKVFALARTADKNRRAAEQKSVALAEEVKGLRREVEERSLRLAEVELSRREMERTVSVMKTSQAASRFRVGDPSEGEHDVKFPSVITHAGRVRDGGPRGKVKVGGLLQHMPASPAVDAPARGVRRMRRFGMRVILLIAAVGVTALSVYGLKAMGHLASEAHGRQAGLIEQAGHSTALSAFIRDLHAAKRTVGPQQGHIHTDTGTRNDPPTR